MSPTLRLITCALLAGLPSVHVAADTSTPVPIEQALLLGVDGKLTIDQQGVPSGYEIKTKLPQKLHDSLEQRVRSWRFEPVLIGGKPVIASTAMHVTLAALGTGDDYRVSVDSVSFPQTQGQAPDASGEPLMPTIVKFRGRPDPPDYPRDAFRRGLEADVLVYLRLRSDGHVDQATVAQVALLNAKGKPSDLNGAAKLFEREALSIVPSWRFDVTVNVPNPTASDMTIAVPLSFRLGDARPRDVWQHEARTAKRRAPWLPADPAATAVGVADLANGEYAPAASRFRLIAPVTGSAL